MGNGASTADLKPSSTYSPSIHRSQHPHSIFVKHAQIHHEKKSFSVEGYHSDMDEGHRSGKFGTLSPELFQEFMNKAIDYVANRPIRTWMCAVDGSSQSHDAFLQMLALKRKNDHIILFHAYSTLEIFPKYEELKIKYEAELTSNHNLENTTFLWVDLVGRTLRESLIDVMFDFANDVQDKKMPDYLLLGYSGHNFQATEKRSIGSTADSALRSLHIPTFFIKKPFTPSPKSFVVAVNDTDVSKRGFQILLSVVDFNDSITCIYVPEDKHLHRLRRSSPRPGIEATGHSVGDATAQCPTAEEITQQREGIINAVRSYYDHALETHGPEIRQFVVVNTDDGCISPAEAIVRFVNMVTPDVFAISPRASQEHSSLTEQCIKNINSTIFLCKPPPVKV